MGLRQVIAMLPRRRSLTGSGLRMRTGPLLIVRREAAWLSVDTVIPILRSFPFGDRVADRLEGRRLNYKRRDLIKSAAIMYGCCTDTLNHAQFMSMLGMYDTFTSWFRITELHVWLCAVRLQGESNDSVTCRRELLYQFVRDVRYRSQLLKSGPYVGRQKGLRTLQTEFVASLYNYDEGLLSGDATLASSIWRQFFSMADDIDPEALETMVHYIRRQVAHLAHHSNEHLLTKGIIRWSPLYVD